MRAFFLSSHLAPIALGLLLSPEALTRLGNGIGQSGALFPWLIAFSALMYLANGWIYDRLQHFLHPTTVESHPLGILLGLEGSHLFPMVTRVPAFVCLGTGVLATAGFVFNEVFVYWFPNFAFAFLLLGTLLAVSLTSPRVALMLQTVFVSVVVAGIIALTVAGCFLWSNTPVPEAARPAALAIRPASVCLVLFMGFELSLYGPQMEARLHPASRFVVAAAAVLFLAWSIVSVHLVPLEKLAESSVPHMMTARAILGEPGRIIMGIVVLAGCCGVVNGAFLALYGLAAGLLHSDEAGPPSHQWLTPGRIAILALAGAIAAALASGLAGESDLEVWLRGSTLLWLLGYAVFHLSLCLLTLRNPSTAGTDTGAFSNRARIHGALLLVFTGTVAASIWTDPERASLLSFMLVAPFLTCIILLPCRRVVIGRRRGA